MNNREYIRTLLRILHIRTRIPSISSHQYSMIFDYITKPGKEKHVNLIHMPIKSIQLEGESLNELNQKKSKINARIEN